MRLVEKKDFDNKLFKDSWMFVYGSNQRLVKWGLTKNKASLNCFVYSAKLFTNAYCYRNNAQVGSLLLYIVY